jgi:hypothetical protein
MLSSSGTDESSDDESSSDEDSFSKSTDNAPKEVRKHRGQAAKFKPIGPDSNAGAASETKLSKVSYE